MLEAQWLQRLENPLTSELAYEFQGGGDAQAVAPKYSSDIYISSGYVVLLGSNILSLISPRDSLLGQCWEPQRPFYDDAWRALGYCNDQKINASKFPEAVHSACLAPGAMHLHDCSPSPFRQRAGLFKHPQHTQIGARWKGLARRC